MSITNEERMLLDNLIYLNYAVSKDQNESEPLTVEKVVNGMLDMPYKEFKEAVTDKQFYYCKNMVNGMNVDQWKGILNAIAADEKLMNMTLSNIQDENDYTEGKDKTSRGFRAACFTNGNETAVIYRGTVGSFQWQDNGDGGTASNHTASQEQAYLYLVDLVNTELSENKIYVSGHSKGGNMAQLAGITAMGRTNLNIERCLSFNGQGFSKAFLDTIKEEGLLTDEALSKIYTISSSRDIVNSLFISMAKSENRLYLSSNSEIKTPLDYLLQGHIGSDIFDDNGKLKSMLKDPSDMQLFVEDFCAYVSDNYSLEDQDDIYTKIMSLLADNSNMF